MIEALSAALDRAAEMISNPRSIHRIVISGRQRGKQPEFERIDIRPVELKGQLHFQATSHDGRRDTTKNYLPHDLSLAALMNLGFGNLIALESKFILLSNDLVQCREKEPSNQ